MKSITASDRTSLIRLASGLPKGDHNRRAILPALHSEPALLGQESKRQHSGTYCSLTAQDRSALVKLASGLPKGDTTRRAILAGLLGD
jgi:hypothetical protein